MRIDVASACGLQPNLVRAASPILLLLSRHLQKLTLLQAKKLNYCEDVQQNSTMVALAKLARENVIYKPSLK